MAKRLIPTLNRVLIEKIVPPSKTTAGILLPESSAKVNKTYPSSVSSNCLWVSVCDWVDWLIGWIGCSLTQGRWLLLGQERKIRLEMRSQWLWRKVTLFFCPIMEAPKWSLVTKSEFIWALYIKLGCYVFWGFCLCWIGFVGFCVQVPFVPGWGHFGHSPWLSYWYYVFEHYDVTDI